MDPEEKSRLEFKRKFVLENLERIKKGHDRVSNRSDSIKQWAVTVWFGIFLLAFKVDLTSVQLFLLLFFEILIFYLLDSYYQTLAFEYGVRITKLEKWIMTRKDEDILNLKCALYDIEPRLKRDELIQLFFEALRHRYIVVFYCCILTITIVSVVII